MHIDKPIMMSGPMVRAVMAGIKGETRRTTKLDAVNEAPDLWDDKGFEHAPGKVFAIFKHKVTGEVKRILCPYGVPGGMLWVRENMIADHETSDTVTLGKYEADGAYVVYPGPATDQTGEDDYGKTCAHWDYKNGDSCPSIHMPRRFSRITLDEVQIAVQRLQDITDADAVAEGARFHNGGQIGHSGFRMDDGPVYATARGAFAAYINLLHGGKNWREKKTLWTQNPWVWVVRFQPHCANIDDFINHIEKEKTL